MAITLGLILTVSALLVGSNAQFNPRFQPAFAPPPSQFPQLQRNLNPYADFNGLGFPQMPAFGPSPGRMGFGPQAPYGSPLFNSNSLNELSMLEQQQMLGPISAYHRRPSFAQFGAGPSMMMPPSPMMHQPAEFGGLPPAFASLPPAMSGLGGMNSPVGGRSPFQRTTGVEMGGNSAPPAFSGLEPFQQLSSSNAEVPETKQKRSTN